MLPELPSCRNHSCDWCSHYELLRKNSGCFDECRFNKAIFAFLRPCDQQRADLVKERKEHYRRSQRGSLALAIAYAEKIASLVDGNRFGVKPCMCLAAQKMPHAAGPGSDIDLLIHFRGSEEQLQELILWLEGGVCAWLKSLLKTGHQSEGLIRLSYFNRWRHAKKSSYAGKNWGHYRCRVAFAFEKSHAGLD